MRISDVCFLRIDIWAISHQVIHDLHKILSLNGSTRKPEWFECIKIGYKTSLEFYLLNAKN